MKHENQPIATVVVPAFNVASTIEETLIALQEQTLQNFEILVIDDGSTDQTAEVVKPFLDDKRIRFIRQANRGLAGARNTGIMAAKSSYIGFCDADDLWTPDKLRLHVKHLSDCPTVGVSYSGSILIDDTGAPLGVAQSPKLAGITPADILKRNPVGNGSAFVLRCAALDDIAYHAPGGGQRLSYFDETFRQSEDIEFWLRMALSTDWDFEGIGGHHTLYRVAKGGLSAQTDRQLESWEAVITKLRNLDPDFFAAHERAARAYQLRYLARRAVSGDEGRSAMAFLARAFAASKEPFWAEPNKSITTGVAAVFTWIFGVNPMTLLSTLRTKSTL
ncbi:MAG: glycosyltransferase family 2 protein [Cognatishimia sp.]